MLGGAEACEESDAMTHCNRKQLVLVGRMGPAFSPGEIPISHSILDSAGVTRQLQGIDLTLPERIMCLVGMLEDARAKQQKFIVIAKKDEFDAMIQEYPEPEVGS